MTDQARDEGRVWAQRLLAFYGRGVDLEPDDRATLESRMEEAIAAAVRAGLQPGRWPKAINAALDAWEASSGRAGPRVAHVDIARGVITKQD